VPKSAASAPVEQESKSLNRKGNVWAKVLGFSQNDTKRDENPALS